MPTDYWWTLTSGTYVRYTGQWNSSGGAVGDAWQIGGGRAGPPTHGGAYMYTNVVGSWRTQDSQTDWPGINDSGPIGAVSAVTCGMRTVRLGSVNAVESACGLNNSTTYVINIQQYNPTYWPTWTVYGPSAISRPGGGSWGPADFVTVNTTCATGRAFEYAANDVRTDSIFGQITYTVPAGGFVYLLGLAGLMAWTNVQASGILGTLTDWSQFRAYLDWRTANSPRHPIWAEGEAELAWAEVRAYKFPVQFDLALA